MARKKNENNNKNENQSQKRQKQREKTQKNLASVNGDLFWIKLMVRTFVSTLNMKETNFDANSQYTMGITFQTNILNNFPRSAATQRSHFKRIDLISSLCLHFRFQIK